MHTFAIMPAKKSTKKSECDVCCEEYTKCTRKQLVCPICGYCVCIKCAKQFLLSTYQEPHCMKCHTVWDRDFWMDIFSKAFINGDYKKHRENVLFDREKSLLPLSQPEAERVREIENYEKRKHELTTMILQKSHELDQFNDLHRDPTNDDTRTGSKKIYMEMHELVFERDYIDNIIHNLEGTTTGKKSPEQKKQFVRACPINNCKGMLSTQWKCGLCGVFVCNKCHEVIGEKKDAPHECKQENIDTVKLLDHDTKPCPKCASIIFRTSGCDQIFCTNCHHAFDWKTGTPIDYGRLHNPHFFEWRAHNEDAEQLRYGEQNNDCNAVPEQSALRHIISKFKLSGEYNKKISQQFLSAYRHNSDIAMAKYRPDNDENRNERLRVDYLLGKITDEYFKKCVFVREKKNAKYTEIYRVIELYVTISREILIRLSHANTASQFLSIWNETSKLIDYVNSQFKIISSRYHNVCPEINLETYRVETILERKQRVIYDAWHVGCN